MADNWSQIDLKRDPKFVVGRRKSNGSIEALRVEIHKDTFDHFRDIAKATLDQVNKMRRRPYAPFGALDEKEYFFLPLQESQVNVADPVHRIEAGNTDDAGSQGQHSNIGISLGPDQTTAALDMVRNASSHEVLHAQRLHALNAANEEFSLQLNLYAISFLTPRGPVGFIRRTGPRRTISPGFKYFQYGDTLTSIEQPDFVLDGKIDVVVGIDEILLLSDMAAQILFRDVRLALKEVPGNVDTLVAAFANDLPLSANAIDALRQYCGRGPQAAKRLHGIARGRIDALSVDKDALSRHGLDVLLEGRQLNLTTDQIPVFFDYLEGRLYHDDHTSEARRADRYSKRSINPSEPPEA